MNLIARNLKNLESVRESILKEYPDLKVRIFSIDLTMKDAAENVYRLVGDVDILINNAGSVPSGNIFDLNDMEFESSFGLKVFGYIKITKTYYNRMKLQGGGVIINNIGNGGEICDPQYIAGAVVNSSLMAFTRALGGYSLDDNIRVIGVNPGPVNSARIYKMLKIRAKYLFGNEDRYMDLVPNYPLGRPAHVSEVTSVIVFLASPHASYISGTIVTVDGGISSRRSVV